MGSLTMIGTVSPAAGNVEEPVTQATLSTVKTFPDLSCDRADKRFYPAIDPLISWSRYLHQFKDWFGENPASWVEDLKAMRDLLVRGNSILSDDAGDGGGRSQNQHFSQIFQFFHNSPVKIHR